MGNPDRIQFFVIFDLNGSNFFGSLSLESESQLTGQLHQSLLGKIRSIAISSLVAFEKPDTGSAGSGTGDGINLMVSSGKTVFLIVLEIDFGIIGTGRKAGI